MQTFHGSRLTCGRGPSILRASHLGRSAVNPNCAADREEELDGGLLLEVPCVLSRSLLRWRVLGVGVYAVPSRVHRHRIGLLVLWPDAQRGIALRRSKVCRGRERHRGLQVLRLAPCHVVVRSSPRARSSRRRMRRDFLARTIEGRCCRSPGQHAKVFQSELHLVHQP